MPKVGYDVEGALTGRAASGDLGVCDEGDDTGAVVDGVEGGDAVRAEGHCERVALVGDAGLLRGSRQREGGDHAGDADGEHLHGCVCFAGGCRGVSVGRWCGRLL